MPLAEPRSAVAASPTKPVVVAWARKVPTPTRTKPASTAGRLGHSSNGRPLRAIAEASQKVGRMPKRRTVNPAAGVVTIDGRNTKYTKPKAIAPTANGSRTSTKLTYVKVPMNANRMQNPIAKQTRSGPLQKCARQAAKGEAAAGVITGIGGVRARLK